MTKDSFNSKNWELNYSNKLLSGIEIRNNKGKLVNFITIKHEEILDSTQAHRISISLNENSEPILPEPQTFEQMIQAKRRQQNILFAQSKDSQHHRIQHNSSIKTNRPTPSTSSVLSTANSRTIRRTTARRTITNALSRARKTLKNKALASSSASRQVIVGGKKRKLPKSTIKALTNSKASTSTAIPHSDPSTSGLSNNNDKSNRKGQEIDAKELKASLAELKNTHTGGTSAGGSSSAKSKIAETEMDPKELKLLLKATPPGATVVLPSGLVIRKSRRGGARAGAGRKRSRPLPDFKQNDNHLEQESMNLSESGTESLMSVTMQVSS